MLKILVTGGLGFIGSNFITDAIEKSVTNRLVNIDNLSTGSNLANLEQLDPSPKYLFVRGDINDRELLRRQISESNVIINFAAESHVDRSISNSWPFVHSNTEGVLSILEAIRKAAHDVSLIHVSTDEVYGDIPKTSATEEDSLNPSSPYAASKASGDLLCLAYHRTYGLKVLVTRCTNNFGPYQFPEKFIPKTIIRADLGLKVPVYGDGENVRDWIYVKDHCRALELVMRKGKPGSIYNIAGHNELKNIQLVRMILKMMKKPTSQIEMVEDRPGHDRRYSLNDQKIRKELGWKPEYTLEDALEKTVLWYLENKEWWRPIADEETLSPTPWKLGW